MNTEYRYQKEVVINVFDVYGHGPRQAPEGWKIIAFRPPLYKEWYLCGMQVHQAVSGDHTINNPFLILEKLPEIPQFPLSHPITFEDVYGMSFEKFYFCNPIKQTHTLIAFRPPKKGELYVSQLEAIYPAQTDYFKPYLIVTCKIPA